MNQKVTLLLLPVMMLAGLALSGCTRSVYQVTKVVYAGESLDERTFVIDHQDLEITYDFWANNGRMKFQAHNKLDQPITIDFRHSSFIVNDRSFPYVNHSSLTSFEVVVSSYDPTIVNGSAITSSDQSLLTIPPNTFVEVSKFHLNYPNLVLPHVRIDEVVPLKTSPSTTLSFSNYLAYRIGEEDPLRFIEDPFVTTSTEAMGKTAAQLRENQVPSSSEYPRNLQFYRAQSQNDDGGTFVLFLLAGLGGAWWIAKANQAD